MYGSMTPTRARLITSLAYQLCTQKPVRLVSTNKDGSVGSFAWCQLLRFAMLRWIAVSSYDGGQASGRGGRQTRVATGAAVPAGARNCRALRQ